MSTLMGITWNLTVLALPWLYNRKFGKLFAITQRLTFKMSRVVVKRSSRALQRSSKKSYLQMWAIYKCKYNYDKVRRMRISKSSKSLSSQAIDEQWSRSSHNSVPAKIYFFQCYEILPLAILGGNCPLLFLPLPRPPKPPLSLSPSLPNPELPNPELPNPSLSLSLLSLSLLPLLFLLSRPPSSLSGPLSLLLVIRSFLKPPPDDTPRCLLLRLLIVSHSPCWKNKI